MNIFNYEVGQEGFSPHTVWVIVFTAQNMEKTFSKVGFNMLFTILKDH